ncbi:sacsin N-terminal ATP-binding-like domain-containing protein [Streptomyces sp. NPDC050535]|uniref:sacsin N-terminal ATP-binding-like domain-containing protein n=1 Tax=Streptomyces sp. NPDC050535 TaxID=3365626 RepID=UPI0037BC0DA6
MGKVSLSSAVRSLLDDPRADPELEVSGVEQAADAVRLLDEGLRSGLGVYRSMAAGAQQGAESLSSDPLQVLSEFVQNANDAQAGQLRFLWSPDALLIAHDGVPVHLGDILLLGMPWLSGKTTDARSTGRFGIGLSTLRAIATTWEVHCHPFHVRYAGLTLEPVARPELPEEISGPGWTVFRIALEPGQLPADQLFTWFESWSDASLLFLRHLERVEVMDGNRRIVLALSWKEAGHTHVDVGGRDTGVTVRHATTIEGTVWRVYEAQVTPHPDWKRHHKALGSEVPVTVALPLRDLRHGCVHAGLPVAPLDMAARVHSQFDPVASREGFAGSQLNQQLVPLIADLWEAAVRDVLGHVDPAAWHLIPLPSSGRATPQGQLQDLIRSALQARARQSLAEDLVLPASDVGPLVPLNEFAVEEATLTGVVDDAELTRLTGASHAFPPAARDRAGRWRRVLADWRAAGAELRPEVPVTDALVLFGDADREVVRTVRLAAVTIESGHDLALMHKPCLVTKDGHVLAPFDRRHAYAEGPVDANGPLDLLGVVHDLHPAYWAEDPDAKGVIEWLRNRGRLIRRNDTAGVLRIVARLGKSGGRLPDADDTQEIDRLTALQRALGDLPKTARNTLGTGIGRAVRLNGFSFDDQGEEKPHKVEPSAAYLSAALESADGDRFAVAARKTPGLVWVHRSYARSLLSATQGNGLSRTAFLRLLGVADTPRLTPVPRARFHHTYFKEYAADPRIGLSRQCMWSLTDRRDAMSEKGAQYTLDDLVSDDLQAVVADIVAEQNVDERRRRTAALLRTLAGPLTGSDARVPMARADRKWFVRGETSALWVWQLRDSAWLEDTTGALRAPTALQLRTPDAEALYGHSDPDYLHGHIQRALATRTEVLTSLGVCGDPDVPRLTARLHELRKRTQDGDELGDGLRVEALLVYRALARRLTDRSAEVPRSEVEKQIRRAFTAEALVLTDQGWKTANSCFRGAAVLRGFRPFTFSEPALDPLWRFLGVGEPEAEDLADVLKEISRRGDAPDGRDQQVMLNALRCLRDRLGAADGQVPLGLRNKLRPLPLWTTSGWTRTRPVYAVDHVGVERSLAERLPLWRPGGDTRQFTPLFGLLRVTPLDVVGAQVIDAHHAVPDRALTEDFHRAVVGLQDLLVRDEPEVAESFADWDWLAALEVRLHPGLRISLELDGAREPIEVAVDAHTSREQGGVVFLRSAESLQTKRGAGTAIASLFPEQRQRVGHRWRDVWEEHLANLTVETALTSTRQQDREERRRLDDQLRRREQESPAPHPAPVIPTARPASGVPARRPASATPSTALASTLPPSPQPAPPPAARLLVDEAAFNDRTFTVTTTGAPSASGPSFSSPTRTGGSVPRSSSLPLPRPGGAPPREQSAPLGYRDADKERRVLHALRHILREEGIELEDQRGVPGFGADAHDSTGRYFEIKAHGGAVPSELSLTRAEFTRAMTESDNYVLVIASHLEKDTGTPTLRLVPDPVNSFEIELPTEVRLMGVRNMGVASTVYEWPSVE